MAVLTWSLSPVNRGDPLHTVYDFTLIMALRGETTNPMWAVTKMSCMPLRFQCSKHLWTYSDQYPLRPCSPSLTLTHDSVAFGNVLSAGYDL